MCFWHLLQFYTILPFDCQDAGVKQLSIPFSHRPKTTQRSELLTWLAFVLPIWPVTDLAEWIFHLCSIYFSSVYFLASSVITLWFKPAIHAVSFVENAYFLYHEIRCTAFCFHREADENCGRLGYLAKSSGNFLPTFRYYELVPSSRDSWSLQWYP